MNVFKGKGWRYVSAGIYIFLTFLSFYCACYRLPVGLKYAINLAIAGMGDVSHVFDTPAV